MAFDSRRCIWPRYSHACQRPGSSRSASSRSAIPGRSPPRPPTGEPGRESRPNRESRAGFPARENRGRPRQSGTGTLRPARHRTSNSLETACPSMANWRRAFPASARPDSTGEPMTPTNSRAVPHPRHLAEHACFHHNPLLVGESVRVFEVTHAIAITTAIGRAVRRTGKMASTADRCTSAQDVRLAIERVQAGLAAGAIFALIAVKSSRRAFGRRPRMPAERHHRIPARPGL